VPELVTRLIARRKQFLAFVTGKLGDRSAAEDLLQDAYARLDKLEQLRDEQAAVAWFYRVLRNAITDRARREQSKARALDALAHEPLAAPETNVCQCVRRLSDELAPAHREALEHIELAGTAVKDYAEQAGITANSAGVRIHRARQALRARVQTTCGACAARGCMDCTC
jgi:RNA polymerase sigma factor (sigma-70 family)